MSGFSAPISLSISISVTTVLHVLEKAFPPGVPAGHTCSSVIAAFAVAFGGAVAVVLFGGALFFSETAGVWADATEDNRTMAQNVVALNVETKPRKVEPPWISEKDCDTSPVGKPARRGKNRST